MDFATVINKVTHLLNKSADMILEKEFGFGFTEYFILMATKYTPDTSQRDIADFLQITQASVSNYIARMVEEGLLEKTENARNRRKNTIQLTAHGEKIYKKSYRLIESHMSELLVEIQPEFHHKMMNELHNLYQKLSDFVCEDKQIGSFSQKVT